VRVYDTKAVVDDGRLRHYVTSARVGRVQVVLAAEHARFTHK
jgi:hypothetical protein